MRIDPFINLLGEPFSEKDHIFVYFFFIVWFVFIFLSFKSSWYISIVIPLAFCLSQELQLFSQIGLNFYLSTFWLYLVAFALLEFNVKSLSSLLSVFHYILGSSIFYF